MAAGASSDRFLEHRHQWEKKGVKPVFGAKSSATNVEFTVFFRASLAKSVGKKKKYTPLFFSTKL